MAAHFAEKDIARLEMLSDGVFAIAITLLGLELKVPPVDELKGASLLHALGQQWHLYIAVVTSFFTILVVWMNHHGCVQAMKQINIRFLIANGFLLFSVICFPFVTGLLGEYFTTAYAATASAAYAGVCLLTNVGFNLLWAVGAAHGRAMIKEFVPASVVHAIRRNCAGGFFAYALAMASALISAYLCIAICTFLWIFWAVTLKQFKEQMRGPATAQ